MKPLSVLGGVEIMSTELTPEQITQSVLQWPAEKRLELIDALRASLIDPSVDHGPEDPEKEVEAGWKDEIGKRIADIDSGRVKTIPADEAERIVRGDVPPAAI